MSKFPKFHKNCSANKEMDVAGFKPKLTGLQEALLGLHTQPPVLTTESAVAGKVPGLGELPARVGGAQEQGHLPAGEGGGARYV